MNQFKVEVIGNSSYLSYTVGEQETLDSLVLGMLSNNSIAGLIPLSTIQFNKLHIFRYEITDLHSLETEIDNMNDGRKLLLLLKGIVDAVLMAQEYMIDENHCMFDSKYIYVDSECQSHLVCLPVERDPDNSLKQFCISLINHPKVVSTLSYSTFSAVKKYLNQDLFQPQEFSNFLADLELNSAIVKSTKASHSASLEGGEAIVLGRRERISSIDTFSESGTDKKPIILSRKSLKDLPASGGTVYLNDTLTSSDTLPLCDDDGETVSLVDKKIVCAFLVRRNTQEKIEISRDDFLIGKSRSDNDYCIHDNPAVSRHHAKIVRNGNDFYIIDTDSKNHVYINRRIIERNCKIQLSDKDQVRLANEDFVFILEMKTEI